MSAPEPYGLRLLRRSATKDYSVTVLPSEAADVVAEIEELRATVAALQAAVPPAHPSDYGHEAWTAALRDAEAKGRREMRDEAVSVAEDYDGEGTDHGQYTQLGDASRTMHDIARSIRSLPDTEAHHADR
jgi:hypothetical protein